LTFISAAARMGVQHQRYGRVVGFPRGVFAFETARWAGNDHVGHGRFRTCVLI